MWIHITLFIESLRVLNHQQNMEKGNYSLFRHPAGICAWSYQKNMPLNSVLVFPLLPQGILKGIWKCANLSFSFHFFQFLLVLAFLEFDLVRNFFGGNCAHPLFFIKKEWKYEICCLKVHSGLLFINQLCICYWYYVGEEGGGGGGGRDMK